MKKQIAVVGHKPFEVPLDSAYLGIQVGNGPDIPSLVRDNTADNISSKNTSYCELTAQYWLWKNSTADIKGLVHYRRILGSPNAHAVPFESIDTRRNKAVAGTEIESLLKTHDVILPKSHNYVSETALGHYERSHISGEGFSIIREYLVLKYPKYVDNLDVVLNSKHSHLLNILIANSDVFDSYSEWLFDVLGEVGSKLDISNYSPVEKRVFGYLSELLIDVWVKTNHLSYAELPTLFLEHQNLPKRYFISGLKKLGIVDPASQERAKLKEQMNEQE